MGLIDRMLADLVGKSTGLNPRMVRRLIRGKGSSILLMGGAAAVGAAIAEQRQGQPGQPGQPGSMQGQAPPPATLPPVPGSAPGHHADNEHLLGKALDAPGSSGSGSSGSAAAAPPPSLPPVPVSVGDPSVDVESADDVSDLPADAVFPIVRAMIAAALADGSLDDAERDAIHRHLTSGGLSDDQVAQVHRELVVPASVTDLAAAASAREGLDEAMFRLAGAVILADDDVRDVERAWLARFADALGFDTERRLLLEAEIFADEESVIS